MSKRRSIQSATFAAAALVTAAVGSVGAQSRAIPVDPAKYLVIDCMLPGRIIKQGGLSTRLSPERPARVTATECEIRGGRYVAYDRANYETALAFWRPQAELGDADAQAYVGEIFEKGLGTAPNHELAAEWYGRAAERGHARAQLSLAYLYEQGLGVPRDALKALNLYREATGIEDDGLTYVSELTAVRDEAARLIGALTTQLEEQNTAVQGLQRELRFAQTDLAERRTQLSAVTAEAAELRSQVEELERRADPAREAELDRLSAGLRDKEEQLAFRTRQVADAEAVAAERRTELSRSLHEASIQDDAIRARLVDGSEADELRRQLREAQDALHATEQRVVELTAALAQERANLALERQRALSESASIAPELRREIAVRETRIVEQESQIASLHAEQRTHLALIAELREQERSRTAAVEVESAAADTARAELASAQQRLLETEQRVADLSAQLIEERARIALEREELARRSAALGEQQRRQLEELNTALSVREARLAEQEALIRTLEAESSRYRDEIAQLRSLTVGSLLATRSVEGRPAPPAFTPTDKIARELRLGRYHALIIGNNDYEHMPDLSTALNDAEQVARVLGERYGFETRVLQNATRGEILGALNDYTKRLESEDSLLVYYAGHGELDQRNQVGYWLPVNAQRTDNTEWISDQMITNLISVMPARHVLVVADSCYSGVMTRSLGMRLVASGDGDAELRRLKKLAQLPSRTVLTSGDTQPVLDGGGGAHSIFAKFLIEVLESNEHMLEGSALYDAVFEPVQTAAAQLRVDQSPRYSVLADAGHLNGEFLFIPVNN
jgi:uncharacterized caspase-like protein